MIRLTALLATLWGILGFGNTQISGIVIPHHDIVAVQRKEFLQEVSTRLHPKTIILVSPNHYGVGKANIQTVDKTWTVSDGAIASASDIVRELIAKGVGNEPSSFPDEHGISLVLGDIHQAFPDASIVPLIIKSTAKKEDLVQIEEVLKKSCSDCLMVASVDFSHYQPALLANLHDKTALRLLQNMDEDALMQSAEVDSPVTLALLARWAKGRKTERFQVWKHTNSGELLHNPDIETTTHIFGYYEEGKRTAPEKSVTFMFGGDVMLGRMVAHTFLPKGLPHVFDKIGERAFWGVDAGVINLEGPISPVPVQDDYNSKNLIFNFPPQAINALKFLRVSGVSLANNHTANAGKKGLQDTRDLLQKADIQAIGGPGNQDIPNVSVYPGEKLKLVVIGVHALYIPPDISEMITRYKQDPDNRIVIFPHWGVEYAAIHNSYQEKLAHAWIDAGADLIIGAHPHVIQDAEVYYNKPIFYSLGNFVFDQNFSKETQQGLLVAGEFTDKGLTVFGLPTQLVIYQPAMIRGIQKQAILQKLYGSMQKYIQKMPIGDKLFFPL